MSNEARHVEPITPHGHRSPAPVAPAPTNSKPEGKQGDARSDDDLRHDIRRKRDELARTLDALEYKLDVPARTQDFVNDGKREALRVWDERRPLVLGVGGGVAALIIGGIVTSVLVARRRDRW